MATCGQEESKLVEDYDHDDKIEVSSVASSSKLPAAATTTTIQLKIQGMLWLACKQWRCSMTCGACVASIENGLRDQPGILSVKVALLAERAIIECDPSVWSPEKLTEEVEDMGFEAQPILPVPHDTVSLQIYGMTCGACVSSIESSVSLTPGILSVTVSLATERATITYDPTIISGARDLVDLVSDVGFDATLVSDENNAVQLRSLARTKEISQWKHSLQRSLCFAVPVFFISMIFPMVSALRPVVNLRLVRGIYLGDIVCFLLTIPVQFGVGRRIYESAWRALRHGSATMDVLVVFGTTAAFIFSTATLLLAPFSSDADYHPKVFFETSTMLITFISLGRYLENLAKGQTSSALSRLMSLSPSQAIIYTDAPTCLKEKRVPTELVQVGDTVKIVPGDKIPADGTVLRGESTVDESMVTGEVIPVHKVVGEALIGGTVNGSGTFDMLVTRAGKDTALAQIVHLVEEAQTSKAPIQAFADKVAGYFVPIVIGLGMLTFIAWMCIAHTSTHLPHVFAEKGATKFMVCLKLCISVVVVACPCALGLSTPTAVMVGTGVGAQHGILIKGAGPLEASHRVDRIILDKTGTLTVGKLAVVGVKWSHPCSAVADLKEASPSMVKFSRQEDIMLLLAAAEAKSEHPLAKAVASWGLRELGHHILPPSIQVSEFESVTGLGVKCNVSGNFPSLSDSQVSHAQHSIEIGNAAFLAGSHIAPDASHAAFRDREEGLGRTCVFVAVDGALACSISLADTIKGEARQAIDALRMMGIHVAVVTGDQRATAVAIAADVGVAPKDVYAGVSPNGKRSIIEKLQKRGHRVAMVGDGINDSPGLAVADVGIALCTGTDIAMEAADIVLMKADLLDVVAAIDLSKRIFRQIRLNFIWATVYNLFGIPLAMGVFLPWGLHLHPMMAGAAMAFSSVSVVASSLTLRWWRRPRSARRPDDPAGDRAEGFISEVLGAAWDSFGSIVISLLAKLRGRGSSRARATDSAMTRRPSEYGLLPNEVDEDEDESEDDIPMVGAARLPRRTEVV
ncbi:BQ5605_C005g03260 [Microbotryum silenes-dioicae]|uniref:P-type Cu(+) transporter n=1 Tax=Microbotryum silenes-dioicae TaxID=796604 RepID=A0A2X0MES6_9BASI|nr:BQ5605_C005g03260 [Microbotryum silenes-dioicae]